MTEDDPIGNADDPVAEFHVSDFAETDAVHIDLDELGWEDATILRHDRQIVVKRTSDKRNSQ